MGSAHEEIVTYTVVQVLGWKSATYASAFASCCIQLPVISSKDLVNVVTWASAMSLRRTCRELVLEVVLRRALKAGGDGLDRLQMVVDAASLRVLNSFLRMGDLHSEGVTSVELLEESREPLPGLDALYFLRSQSASIERVLVDFKTAPQHRQVHLCFSQPLESTLLSKLVEAPVLAPRVKSFVEVPLSFVVVQDRGFHFDSPEAIMGLFPEPDLQMLSDTVQKLVDVCRCLQATSPVIRFQSELCQDVAEKVQRELGMHKSLTTQSHGKPCQLLILDRSIDMAAALVHEYSYEACVFDLLDGNMLDADRNIVTLNSGGHSKEVLLADPLWEELKYMHLEAARELVEVKVDEVKRQNVQQDATAISTRAMLDQLRAAPEMRDAVDRMALHLAMITQIHSRLNSEQILEPLHLGLLEQDIACGIDRSGKDVKITNLQTTLQRILTDRPELSSEVKLRLLMLFFACVANVPEASRSKLLDVAQLGADDQQALMNMLRTRLMEVPESQRHKHASGCSHRVTKQQSHVVHGYVGNRAAVFPLQLLGFEVDVINSVQFCCHTGYPSFAGQRLSGDDLETLIQGMSTNQVLNHSFLLTGYIGTASFLRGILKLRQMLPASCCYVCDPVLGDNGHMYVPEDLVAVYRTDVLQHVSVLTPNQFEAELLTQLSITGIDDAAAACDKLHQMGPKIVVLTTLDVPEATREGQDVAMMLSFSGRKWMLRLPRVEGGPFTGTGDLTAAMILAWTQRKPHELPLALEKAGAVLQAVIRKTMASSSAQMIGDRRVPPELRLIESKAAIESPSIRFRCQLTPPLKVSCLAFHDAVVSDSSCKDILQSLCTAARVCIVSNKDAMPKGFSAPIDGVSVLCVELGDSQKLANSLSSIGISPCEVLAVGAACDYLATAAAAGCRPVAMLVGEDSEGQSSNGYPAGGAAGPGDHQSLSAKAEFTISSLDSLCRFLPAWPSALFQKAARFKKNAVAEGRFELSRFEPRLKEILEQLVEDRLSLEEFPVLQSAADDFGLREAGAATAEPLGAPVIQAKDDWSFTSVSGGLESEHAVSHRVVVFVIGGFTLSELRVAAEVEQKMPRGTEVIVGGTSLLTPKRLLRTLRPQNDAEPGEIDLT
eukprot:s2456_g11.t2